MGAHSVSEDLQRRRREELLEIRRRLNLRAADLAPKLLPNGRKAGPFWETSNIDDQKKGSYSLKVHIRGDKIGQWSDYGLPRGAPHSAGDMFALMLEREFGGDFVRAVQEARRMTGIEGMSDAEFREARRKSAEEAERAAERQVEDDAKFRARAEHIFHGAFALVHDGQATPGMGYLQGRGIDFTPLGKVPGSLRYHPAVWNTETAERLGRAHAKLPAMVASIVPLRGSLIGVHRHWLDVSAGKNGPVGKAKLDDPKMTLGHSLGGHIPLWKGEHRAPLHSIPVGTDVYMSEGVEDGLSVAIANPRLRVIAGVALSKMGAVELPPQMGDLIVIGQNDPLTNKSAIDALEAIIAAHQARGRTVRTMFPPPEYKDFNDVLMRKKRG